jgi:MFS family permease
MRTALPAGVVALGLVSLFMDMSSEMIHALLPLYLTGTLGASALVVGLIEGVGQAVAQFAKLGSGYVSDVLGRRKLMMVLGYGLGAVTKPVFALAGAPGWVLAARVADRFGKGIRGAPRDAMLADLVPLAQRSAAYGLRQSLDSFGALAGPLIAVALIGIWGLSIPWIFAIAVVPALLSVALLVVAVREPAPVSALSRTRIDVAALRQMGAPVWWAIALGTAITLARFSDAFLVLRADEIGLPLLWIPLILVLLNLVDAATAWPVGVLAGHIGKRGMLLASMAVLALAQLVLGYGTGQGALFVGVALWGLHMGLSQGLLSAMVGEAAPPHLRGTAFGLFGLATGVAVLVGNAVAGAIWASAGSHAMFGVGAALSGLAVLLGLLRRA